MNRDVMSAPNTVMNSPDDTFYVSFNTVDFCVFGNITTALVWGQMCKFYILNGDHRSQYAPLIPQGFDACLDYFVANLAHANKFSDAPPAREDDDL